MLHNQRQNMNNTLRQRIYKLKTTIVALVSFGVGLGLQLFASVAATNPDLAWVGFWQISSIGGTLFAAGLFGIVWDYFDGKDKEERDTERLKRVLADSSAELKDAVIEGFAVGSEDLKRVATPELLDSIATNALALRLDDEAFAREIYQDVRDQAIRARERWYDVQVSVRLSDALAKDAVSPPRFDVTVQWEYTVTPSTSVQKFACTSDSDEFHELLADIPATSTWFMTPRPGFQANTRDAFELLQFSVDGEEPSDSPQRTKDRPDLQRQPRLGCCSERSTRPHPPHVPNSHRQEQPSAVPRDRAAHARTHADDGLHGYRHSPHERDGPDLKRQAPVHFEVA
jgi:hypothetical protein